MFVPKYYAHLGTVGLMAVTLIFNIIALATPDWMTLSDRLFSLKLKFAICCADAFGVEIVVAVFLFLAIFVELAFLIWGIVAQCCCSNSRYTLKVDMGFTGFLTFVYLFLMILYPSAALPDYAFWRDAGYDTSIGYSYYMMIPCLLCCLAADVVLGLSMRGVIQRNQRPPNVNQYGNQYPPPQNINQYPPQQGNQYGNQYPPQNTNQYPLQNTNQHPPQQINQYPSQNTNQQGNQYPPQNTNQYAPQNVNQYQPQTNQYAPQSNNQQGSQYPPQHYNQQGNQYPPQNNNQQGNQYPSQNNDQQGSQYPSQSNNQQENQYNSQIDNQQQGSGYMGAGPVSKTGPITEKPGPSPTTGTGYAGEEYPTAPREETTGNTGNTFTEKYKSTFSKFKRHITKSDDEESN